MNDTENWVRIEKGQTHDFVKGEPYRQESYNEPMVGRELYRVYSSAEDWTYDPAKPIHEHDKISYDSNWKPPPPPITVDSDIFYRVLDMLESEEEDDRRSISSLCFAMAKARKALQEAVIR